MAWLKQEFADLASENTDKIYYAFDLRHIGIPRDRDIYCSSEAIRVLHELLPQPAQTEFTEALLALRAEWVGNEQAAQKLSGGRWWSSLECVDNTMISILYRNQTRGELDAQVERIKEVVPNAENNMRTVFAQIEILEKRLAPKASSVPDTRPDVS